MIVFDAKVQYALDKGLAKQVVLADEQGFVLDNAGYIFDPDELIALSMSTQRQIHETAGRLAFGDVSEFSLSLIGTDLTILCRRVFWTEGGCLIIVVCPVGSSPSLLISQVIRDFKNYVEHQRAAMREI
jgi:hypothetical protein